MITMHPGEYLALSYLEPLQISQAEIAHRLGVSSSSISRLVQGKADLSVDMALRLGRVLDRSPESWLKMQIQHNLATAQTKHNLDTLEPIDLQHAIA